MPRCIVAGCSSKQNKSTALRGVILHVFPPNVDRIKAWLMHIGQDFGNLDEFSQRVLHSKKNGSFRLCSDHFTPQSYVEHASKKLLRVDAVPTIFNIKDAASRPCANKSISTASGNNCSAVSMPSASNISCATSNTYPSYKGVASRRDLNRKMREASTQTQQEETSNAMKSSLCNALSNVVTDPNKIDEIRKKLTDRILQLTLEIIHLLTGEDCAVVKKSSGDYMIPSTPPVASGVWSRSQGSPEEPSPLTPEKSYNKILDVTNKISQLLTGEVPIWCQDVSVSFSMTGKNSEGRNNINKDVMMENRPFLTSLDGSSNGNPPEGCSHSPNSTVEHRKISKAQGENLVIIKVEVKEEPDESYVICGEPCREEEISTEISTDPEDTKAAKRDIKAEEVKEGIVRIKEEEVPIEIGTDARDPQRDVKAEEEEEIQVRIKVEEEEEEIQVRIKEEEIPMEIGEDGKYTMETCSFTMPDVETDEDITDISSDERRIASNSNLLLHRTHFSPDPAHHGGSFSDHSYPIPLRINSREADGDPVPRREKGKGPHVCSLCKKCFSDKSVLRHHEKTHKRDFRYTCLECGKTFLHNSRFISHRRIHTGERPFSCSKCGKSFVNKPDLVRHHRTHTGEKPFSCSDCGKRFTQRVHLVTHQKKHALQKI